MTEFEYLFSPQTPGPDDWKGYADLKRSLYARHMIFHNKNAVEQRVLPLVHLVISLIKRSFLGTFLGRFERKSLQAYQNEFRFRRVQQAVTSALKFQKQIVAYAEIVPASANELFDRTG